MPVETLRVKLTFLQFPPDSNFQYVFSEVNTAANDVDEAMQLEVTTFLNSKCELDPTDLQQLTQRPFLKAVFLKYNTILPSSAPVERVFSVAS